MHVLVASAGLLLTLFFCDCQNDDSSSTSFDFTTVSTITPNNTKVYDTTFSIDVNTTFSNVTTTPPPNKNNLSLILGLSLGLGIFVLLILLMVFMYCWKRKRLDFIRRHLTRL
ncbi:unnamed protein product [Adineta steineri]|uniref:Mid2 domain-containing protein n=1 Tax=Adineta steineri TaxID=433720 RepID=A0A818ZZL8_9BILA|nr:unnamed protein product [Adineta steineri]CAF0828972.1 unnamed protein product [Adineta steineri]CAF3777287.1 unnamed protein product [Adineta steineri]CAF3951362.1 unnamed protein product [Adineta steineri]